MFYLIYLAISMLGVRMTNAEPACSQYHFMEQILEKLVRMEFDVSKLMTETKTLAAEMNQELKQIKEERNNLRSELETFKAQQKNMMVEYGNNQTRELENIAHLSRGVNQTAVDLRTELLKEIHNLTQGEIVAFLARQPTTDTFNTNQVIVYGTVLDNIGDGYDVNTGKFTAPVNGLYSFSVHMCIHSNKYIHYAIVKNDDDLVRGRDYGSGGGYSCSSATVFTSLGKGDQVWVKCSHGGSSNKLLLGYYDYWNSFSGVLIRT